MNTIRKNTTFMILILFVLSIIPFPLLADNAEVYKDIFIDENLSEIYIPFVEMQDLSTLQQETFVSDSPVTIDARKITPDAKSILVYDGIKLEIPIGAVEKEVTIEIIKLESANSVNETIRNVTTGAASYRFLPDGIKFNKNITISIPFNKALLESETALSNLFTYFYDEESSNWERLPRVEIDREKVVVVSLTNHFTDMINGTLKMPESPGPVNFDINSIKSLEAANPSSGVMSLKGLTPDSGGSASFQIPLNLSPGRGSAYPNLALSYNSDSPNSWMGRGFDISVPSITTDTRFGLPKYGVDENGDYSNYNDFDTYILEGEELVLINTFPMAGGVKKVYYPRVEKEFKKIERILGSAMDYWEVTDKYGRMQTFGTDEGWIGPDRNYHSKTYIWYLTKETDANGNFVSYIYDYDSDNKYTYLKEIFYSGNNNINPIDSGPYKIIFNTSELRPDRRIDARGTFISKLARRLDEVQISYNGDVFRSYTFGYEQNEFGQTVLTGFTELDGSGNEFYAYGFEYNKLETFTDVDGNSGYEGFEKDLVTWGAVSGSTFPGLNRTTTFGVGASLYLGLNLELLKFSAPWDWDWKTVANIGVTGGVNFSGNIANSTLMDINGDNLPDAVWKNGGNLKAYQNTGFGFDTSSGNNISLPGLPGLLNNSFKKGYNLGVSARVGSVGGSVSWQNDWTEGLTAFKDINGDGLIDYIKADDNKYYKNISGKFKSEPYISNAVVKQESTINEQDYQRTYYIQEPVRQWKAFTSGTIEISQSSSLVEVPSEPDRYEGVKAVTYLNDGSSYFIELTGSNTSGMDTRDSIPVLDGDEVFFHMDAGNDTRGDDIIWDINIAYTDIDYFGGINESAIITLIEQYSPYMPGNSEDLTDNRLDNLYYKEDLTPEPIPFQPPPQQIWKYTLKTNWRDFIDDAAIDAIIEYGLYIPGRMPEDIFTKVFTAASNSTVSNPPFGNPALTVGDKARLIDAYLYRPEFKDFIRINNTADMAVREILPEVDLSSAEKRSIIYYTDFTGNNIYPEEMDGIKSYSISAPLLNMSPVIYTSAMDSDPGVEFLNGEILIDKIYDETGTEVLESLFLVPDNGSLKLISIANGETSEVYDAEINETEEETVAAFFRNGIKYSYTLSNPTNILISIPEVLYDGELLETVTSDYSFTYPNYSYLSSGDYEAFNSAVSVGDRLFIEEVYERDPPIPPPEDPPLDPPPDPPPIEGYNLIADLSDEQHTKLFLMLDFLSDYSGSILDKPFLSENPEDLGIIAFSADEYEAFIEGKVDAEDLFIRVVSAEHGVFYLIKENLSNGEKLVLEKSEKQYLRDELEFPYYEYNEPELTYTIKEELGEEQITEIDTTFTDLGWSVFTKFERSLHYFPDANFPVTYEAEDPALIVDNPVPEGNDALVHNNPGVVRIPFIDSEGRNLSIKRYIHQFNAGNDYRTENIITYPQDSDGRNIYNKETLLGSTRLINSENSIPEAFEVFSGGIGGWYYGVWTGYYGIFNKSKIRSNPAVSGDGEVALPKYFTSMEQNKDNENTPRVSIIGKVYPIVIGTDALVSDISSYVDSSFTDGGVPESIVYKFAPVINTITLHSDRNGGDTYFNVPRGSTSFSSGRIGNISEGRSAAKDVNGSISSITGSLSLSYNKGKSWQYQELMDINGDRYPDIITYPSGEEGSTHFSVLPGTGSGFSDSKLQYSSPFSHLSYNVNKTFGIGASPQGLSMNLDYNKNGSVRSSYIGSPQSVSGGINRNETFGVSYRTEGFMDMTGDGLPDHVKRSDEDHYFVAVGNGLGFSSNIKIDFGSGISQPFYDISELDEIDLISTPHGISFSNSMSSGLGANASVNFSGSFLKSVGANIGFSFSTNRTLSQLMDINGDGLIDQVYKKLGTDFFKVRFNLGDRFSEDEILIFRPSWDVGDLSIVMDALTTILNQIENTTKTVFNNLGIPGINIDGLFDLVGFPQGTGGYFSDIIDPFKVDDTISYTGGFAINLGANLTLSLYEINLVVARLGLQLIPGINGSYAISTTNLSMQDINGDGLPDHVLKRTGSDELKIKLNSMGKVGLLNKIILPTGSRDDNGRVIGGSIVLEYGRQGNTVAMPQNRYVLTKVTKNDGYQDDPTMAGEHSYSETFDYKNGYYERGERKFYGFGEVIVTKGNGSDQSVTTTTYFNDNYYKKGLVRSIIIEGTKEEPYKPYFEQINAYSPDFYTYNNGIVAYPNLMNETIRTYDPADPGIYIETEKEYSYDNFGNVLTLMDYGLSSNTVPDITLSIGYADFSGNKYLKSHPSSLIVRDSSNEIIREREGTYDLNGNLTLLKSYYSGDGASEYTFGYDGQYGNLVSVEDPLGYKKEYSYEEDIYQYITGIKTLSANGGDSYTSSINYDYRYGVETSQTDSNENILTKEYDNFGRLKTIISPYDTGTVKAVEYNYLTDSFPWKALIKNKISFNAADTKTMDTFVIIDGLNRIISTAKEGEVYFEDGNIYGWNKSGYVVYDSKARPMGEGQTVFEETSSAPSVEKTALRPTLKTYDTLDRILTITFPETFPDVSVITKSYTVEGNRTKETVTDPLGNITEIYKDIRGNIVKIEKKDVSGTILTESAYSYNVLGELLKVTDAEGSNVTFTYDILGRRLTLESPETGLTEFEYDEADHLIRKVDANLRNNGASINYIYDTLGRIEKIDYPFMEDILYTYGAQGDNFNRAGRIVSITNENGSTENFYGELGETIKVEKTIKRLPPNQYDSKTAAFEYISDYQGRMKNITYPDGEIVSYEYNRGGEVEKVSSAHNGLNTTYIVNIGYDEYGQRAYIKYGHGCMGEQEACFRPANGIETKYTYDENRRWLKNILTVTENDSILQDINYTFDKTGNILSIINISSRYTTTQGYEYDGLYQLTRGEGYFEDREHGSASMTTSNYTQNFTYGTTGNILIKTSSNITSPPGGVNALNYNYNYTYYADKPKQAEIIGNLWYLYDSNGNMIEERAGGHSAAGLQGSGTITKSGNITEMNRGIALSRNAEEPENVYKRTYIWDEENRLKTTIDPAQTVEYRYDSTGERTNKRSEAGSETLYFNSMWLATEDSYDFRQSKNIYLGETRIATRLNMESDPSTGYEAVNTYYYHPDHLGSSNIVTTPDGEVFEQIEYTPYGETWVEKSDDLFDMLPYKFTAKELDDKTGLYYYGARYLNPRTSRWISSDPAMDGINWYAYANNNPVTYDDPTGLAPRNRTDQERAAFMQSITGTNVSSIPSRYDCADVGTYLASQAMGAATGQNNYYQNLQHNGENISSISGIQAKDFHNEGSNISFHKDANGDNDTSFNSSNIEVGTIGVFGAKEGATWTGHIFTVTGVKRDEDKNVLSISVIEGSQKHSPTSSDIDQSDFKEYIENTGPFLGWGEIGADSASSGTINNSNPNEGVNYNDENK